MAITVNHTFVSGKEDGGDETVVRPSDWNASHKLRWALNKILKGGGPDAPPTEVDLPGVGVSHNEPGWALDTVYQNTSGKVRFVTINIDGKAEDTIGKTQSLVQIKIGSSSPPGTLVATIGIDGLNTSSGDTLSMRCACSFIVLPSWYYEVEKYVQGVSLSLIDWHEWDLG